MSNDTLFRPVPDNPSEDIEILPSEGHGLLQSADTNEVLEMVLGDDESYFDNDEDDVLFGRLPQGGGMDPSEFDDLPPLEADIPETDEDDIVSGEEEIPDVFQPPRDEHFPVFKQALRKFQYMAQRPRTVRIDTDETHDQFMCERAVAEVSRRLDDLQQSLKSHENDLEAHKALLEAHDNNPSAHRAAFAAHKVDMLGAAQTVANLSAATSAKDVAEAMPKVPLDLPAFAEGKIKCWKDGDAIVCSIRFVAADGSARVATMAATPKADTDEIARHALSAGVDPVVVFGALPDLADVACGKKLVKEVAGAALKAHRRADVCGMAKDGTDDPSLGAEPLFLKNDVDSADAPVAALMHVEQRAKAGDRQARKELSTIHRVAGSSVGKALAPAVSKAQARLAAGSAAKAAAAPKPTLAQRYAHMSLML